MVFQGFSLQIVVFPSLGKVLAHTANGVPGGGVRTQNALKYDSNAAVQTLSQKLLLKSPKRGPRPPKWSQNVIKNRQKNVKMSVLKNHAKKIKNLLFFNMLNLKKR